MNNGFPEDTPPPPPPPAPGNLIDTPPPPLVEPQQREDDFNRVFAWHQREIKFSIAAELYYRDLRVRCGAPPFHDYETVGDFTPEACRILYCAHLDAATIRRLRLQSPEDQLRILDEWTEKNIAPHEFDAAVTLAMEINAAISRARTRPAESGDNIDGAGN